MASCYRDFLIDKDNPDFVTYIGRYGEVIMLLIYLN